MVKLSRFIINSDFDSMKIDNRVSWDISIPATVIGGSSMQPFEYTYTISPGVYFEMQSVRMSVASGLVFTGAPTLVYDDGSSLRYTVVIFKISDTQYKLRLEVNNSSGSSVTMPALSINAKLNLLIPSDQQ